MAARNFALWSSIRADFLANGMPYSQLAEKYSVSLSTLKKRAASEKWMDAREKVVNGTYLEPARKKEPEPELEPIGEDDVAVLIDLKRERYQKFMEITDAMMDRISAALTSPEVVSPYSLKMLASALRDLREMQGLNKTELDLEEQRARIAKLKSEIKTVESDGDGGIIYMPVMADRPEPPEDDNA